jgi:hypothetical protein
MARSIQSAQIASPERRHGRNAVTVTDVTVVTCLAGLGYWPVSTLKCPNLNPEANSRV